MIIDSTRQIPILRIVHVLSRKEQGLYGMSNINILGAAKEGLTIPARVYPSVSISSDFPLISYSAFLPINSFYADRAELSLRISHQ